MTDPESGERTGVADSERDFPEVGAERERMRGRALFDSGQLFVWEMDLSTAAQRATALAEETDDLVAYLDEHPAEHARILEGMAVLDVDERAVEVYGADSKAHLAENVGEVMTDTSIEKLKGLWAAIADGKTRYRVECEARRLDGGTINILFETCVPAGRDDYSVVYMAGLDVTERQERERELERQNEYLDAVARVVSHDVATPLGVIENNARLVEMTGDPSHVEDIYDATEQIQKLVDDLLELARQGKRIGETEPVALDRVTRQAWRSVETQNGTLSVESSVRVEASYERLRQLLENLLDNAVTHGRTDPDPDPDTEPGDGDELATGADRIEADGAGEADAAGPPVTEVIENVFEYGTTDPGRTSESDGTGRDPAPEGVTIRVGVLADGFYVADDGPGIPADDRSDVFEEGYTTDDAGTGMGLAIVERVADAHGWSVDVTESDLGGARIEVTDVNVHGDVETDSQ